MAHFPEAPKLADLPEPLNRAARRGDKLADLKVSLRVVTPILGGAARTRTIDEVDVIRAPSVRGNLRFWWRALRGHEFSTSTELYKEESALWGRAADDTGGRSQMEVRINVKIASNIIEDDINLNDPGAYALWPARGEGKNRNTGEYTTPPAPRRAPGTQLTLSVRCPTNRDAEVRDAVRAWILFGGYGGRTRRGVGSLTVVGGREDWLPQATGVADLRDGVRKLFGRDVFVADAPETASDLPLLAGAELYIGKPKKQAEGAWHEALGWLREFRQGTTSGARSGGGGGRPGRSNWPKPDKVRHLSTARNDLPWAHPPQHNAEPAWPRAGFGVPIISQFQPKNRAGARWEGANPACTEPDGFQLQWQRAEDGQLKLHDRLASPLIVKALPLADGKFLPCALWLNRAYPERGEVVLVRNGAAVPRSAAPFDRLVAAGDTARFKPLNGKSSLREAFLDWLTTTSEAERVAP
jgi:CRISPR-associated protein Cmr1